MILISSGREGNEQRTLFNLNYWSPFSDLQRVYQMPHHHTHEQIINMEVAAYHNSPDHFIAIDLLLPLRNWMLQIPEIIVECLLESRFKLG